MTEEEIRKICYFDIICEFGLLNNTGHSPVESAAQPLRIPLSLRNAEGVLCRCTAYGKDLNAVCACAYEWLQKYDWKGLKPAS